MKYLEQFAIWFMLTACGTDESQEVPLPAQSTHRPVGSIIVPNGEPKAGEIMQAPEGMKRFKSAETSCTDYCKVQLKVQSQCPSPRIVLVVWELRNKMFYSVGLTTDTSSWQTGDLVNFTTDRKAQVDYADVEYLGYENQSGVFYACP